MVEINAKSEFLVGIEEAYVYGSYLRLQTCRSHPPSGCSFVVGEGGVVDARANVSAWWGRVSARPGRRRVVAGGSRAAS
jgi:hypothetical protein